MKIALKGNNSFSFKDKVMLKIHVEGIFFPLSNFIIIFYFNYSISSYLIDSTINILQVYFTDAGVRLGSLL
jgi:hypothetical protein